MVRIIVSVAPDFMVYYLGVIPQNGTQHIVTNLLPPASRLVYWPIVLLPYQWSQALWVFVSIFCLWISIRYTLHMLGNHARRDAILYMAVAFLSFPTRFTLGMGQVNLIALALIVVAAFKEKKHQSLFGGILYGVAILLKPELILLYPVFLLTRRWQFCIASITTIIAAALCSLIFFERSAYPIFIERMSSLVATLEGWDIYYNQSLSAMLTRFGLYSGLKFVYIGLSITILAVSLWFTRYKKIGFPILLWVMLPVFLIIEPIAWQHHLVFLIPTYLFVWEKYKKFGGVWFYGIFWISYLLVSWNIKNPVYWQQSPVGALVLSHGFIGVIVTWVLALISL
ncbi:MAG: glycosyltransferase family 87 protein [Patescibacteria group bacterium]